jgi:hypothetical protein
VTELGVPVRVLRPLVLLGRSLARVTYLPQQAAHRVGRDLMAHLPQCPGQLLGRFRRPPQRAHRINTRVRLHQIIEIGQQRGPGQSAGADPHPGAAPGHSAPPPRPPRPPPRAPSNGSPRSPPPLPRSRPAPPPEPWPPPPPAAAAHRAAASPPRQPAHPLIRDHELPHTTTLPHPICNRAGCYPGSPSLQETQAGFKRRHGPFVRAGDGLRPLAPTR